MSNAMEMDKKKVDSSDDSSDEEESDVPSDPEVDQIIKDLDAEKDDPDDLPKKSDKRVRKVKAILREYAQLSSTHAVDHMGEAHTVRVILFWSIMLLICAGVFALLFQDTARTYFKFETDVQITMESKERYFPAVTICNLNPYKKSALLQVDELAALVQAFELATNS